MPRSVNCHRVAAAALLAALAVLPNVVTVSAAVWSSSVPSRDYSVPSSEIAWVHVHLPWSPRPWLVIDAPSPESAKAVAAGWEAYLRLGLVFAAVAAFVVVREFVPDARPIGRDDETD
jgi:hypothetical protein